MSPPYSDEPLGLLARLHPLMRVDDSLAVRVSDYGAFTRTIAPTARDHGIRLLEVRPTDDSLESVFEYLAQG